MMKAGVSGLTVVINISVNIANFYNFALPLKALKLIRPWIFLHDMIPVMLRTGGTNTGWNRVFSKANRTKESPILS